MTTTYLWDTEPGMSLHLTWPQVERALKVDLLRASANPDVRRQLDAMPPHAVRRYLIATGAWAPHELRDHERNLQRVLWLAASDIVDNPENFKT